MNILAIGAHQDEVEMIADGKLAKYAKAGHKVFIATAANGNKGSAAMSMEKNAEVRKAEAKKAAALIGAEYICLDFEDELFLTTEDYFTKSYYISRFRGFQCGVKYAEAFVSDYTPDRIRPYRILP